MAYLLGIWIWRNHLGEHFQAASRDAFRGSLLLSLEALFSSKIKTKKSNPFTNPSKILGLKRAGSNVERFFMQKGGTSRRTRLMTIQPEVANAVRLLSH